ncbi:MAG TPA: aminoacyl-tRNA hydrolase [Candidatus Sulfotelmatobacter sp.]|nr:aminoacyl-tRNA hydrolase [Candidatus Sulfotelmatobacter sp.]
MKLIIGLGNPGEKHDKTRHNLGFMVLDALFKDYATPKDSFKEEKKFQSEIAEVTWQCKNGKTEKVILAKPTTFMNGSGNAVRLISGFYKINPEDVWVIHDEIDLPLGAMKIRFGGSSAGHKGVESIMASLKSEKFWRFRMGIGKQTLKEKLLGKRLKKIDNFVLSEFGEGEKGKLREVIKRGVNSAEEALENGMEKAMNRFNTK